MTDLIEKRRAEFEKKRKVDADPAFYESRAHGTPVCELEGARDLLDTDPHLLCARVRAEIQSRVRSDINE